MQCLGGELEDGSGSDALSVGLSEGRGRSLTMPTVCGLQVQPAGLGSLDQVLGADLRGVVASSNLPDRVDELHNVILEGNFIMQVNASSNIAESMRSLNIKEKESDAGNHTNSTTNGQPANNSRRSLKLELSDGIQNVVAFERRTIKTLKGQPGEKLLLCNVPVRQGLLLLDDQNTKILGGSLPALQEDDQVASVQARAPDRPSQRAQPKAVQIPLPPAAASIVTIVDSSPGPKVLTQSATAPPKAQMPQGGPGAAANQPVVVDVSQSPIFNKDHQPSRSLDRGQDTHLFSSASPTNSREKRSFCFLSQIQAGDIGIVKAIVMSLSGRLKNALNEYCLNVELSDGQMVCVAKLDSAFVERRLFNGVPPRELDRIKKSNKDSYRKLMNDSGKKLREMEGLFTIKRQTSGQVKFVVQDVQEPDLEYGHFLRKIVQQQSVQK